MFAIFGEWILWRTSKGSIELPISYNSAWNCILYVYNASVYIMALLTTCIVLRGFAEDSLKSLNLRVYSLISHCSRYAFFYGGLFTSFAQKNISLQDYWKILCLWVKLFSDDNISKDAIGRIFVWWKILWRIILWLEKCMSIGKVKTNIAI